MSAGGSPLATAFIEVRGDTSRLPDDIRGGLRGTRDTGRRAGNELGNGLRDGANDGTRRMSDDLERSTRESGRRSGRGFGEGFAGLSVAALGPIGGAIAGIFALDKVKDFFAESVTSLQRIERINAQTENAIKSTGGAAGVSAQHIIDLTGAMEGYTATEAESIQQGANMLLTFTNIKNGVDGTNPIFDRATATINDMARAMDTSGSATLDLNSTAIQLGKALNDPVKGVTALTKVGVTFDEQQRKSIKSMVDMGNTAGAQTIILDELQKEFGGSAEAFAKTTAGKVELAKHAIGTLGETVSGAALPILGNLATKAADALNGAAEAFPGFVDDVKANIAPVAEALTPVVDGFKLVGATIQTIATGDFKGGGIFQKLGIEEDSKYVDVIFDVRDAIGSVVDYVRGLGDGGSGGIAVALGLSSEQIENVYGAVTGAKDAVVDMVSTIVDAFQEFYQSKNIGEYFQLAQTVITAVVDWIIDNVVPFFADHLPQAIAIFGDVFQLVGLVVQGALQFIQAAIGAFVDIVMFIWRNFGDTILFVIKAAWDLVSGVISGALDVIQGIVRVFIALFKGDWQGLGDALAQIGRGAMDIVSSIFQGALDALQGAFRLAVDGIQVIWGGIQDAVKTPIRFVIETVLNSGLIDGFNWIADKVGADGLKIPHIPLPKGFSGGGYTGDGGKYEPMGVVHGGEWVIPKEATAKLRSSAPGFLEYLNGFMPGYTNGGIVALGKWFQSKGARVTENSAFGGTTPGAHVGRGHAGDYAIDVNYGPGGENATEKAFFDSVVDQVRKWGYKALWRVAGHFNHLHAETQNAQGGGMVGEDGGFLSGLLGGLSDPVKWLQDKLTDSFTGMGSAGALGDILRAVPGSLVGALVDKAKDAASSVIGFFTGENDSVNGDVKQQVQAVAKARGWDSGAQWSALSALIQKESSWDPGAKNPNSSARGLFQKMTSIHGPVEATAAGQAGWGLNYIASRYGDPIAAWNWHKAHNWYAGGTPSAVGGLSWVGENGPELVDFRGGERVYNAALSRKMEASAVRDGGSGPLVGSLTLQSSGNVRDDLGTLHHNLKLIDRGGSYRRRGSAR